MAAEKKIRVTLEDDVSNKVERLGQNTAKSLAEVSDSYSEIDDVVSGLIQDSEKYNNSVKDRIKWIEKEIAAQRKNAQSDQKERRDKLDHERRLGKEKSDWSKQDEIAYQRKKRNLDSEKREENDYYERLRAKVSDKAGEMSRQPEGGTRGLEDRARQYLHESRQLDNIQEESEDNGGSGGGRFSRFGRRISGGLRAAGNGALAAAGFGAVLSISGFIGKMIDESRSLDEARNKLSGSTGSSYAGGSQYGLKESAFMDYARSVSIARGRSSISEAENQLALEKGFGLDIGSTSQFNRTMRMSEGGQTLTDATLDMLNIMKKTDLYNIRRGDFTQLHELMERQNSLNELQAAHKEEISARDTSLVMSTFGKIGGSFSDQRQLSTLNAINSSITDPNNDFKQAFLLRTLREANPGASFLDLRMRQEEGIFGKGTFSGLMSNLSKTFSGDQLTFSMSKMFGLNLHQSKRLQEYYANNPEAFNNMSFTNEEEFKKFIDGGGFDKNYIKSRGKSKTGTIEGWSADFDSWMAKKGDKGVQYAKEMQGAYDSGGFGGVAAKLSSDIVQAIKDGFAAVAAKPMDEALNLTASLNYNDKEVQADFNKVLKSMTPEELEEFRKYALPYELSKTSGGNFGSGDALSNWFGGVMEELFNSGSAGEYNKTLGELLAKHMPDKYKGTDDEGRILKVMVVNQPTTTPKNTTRSGGHN